MSQMDYAKIARDKIETMKMLAAIHLQANKSTTERYYEDGTPHPNRPERWQHSEHEVTVCNPISNAMREIDEEIYLRWIECDFSDPIEWIVEQINKENDR